MFFSCSLKMNGRQTLNIWNHWSMKKRDVFLWTTLQILAAQFTPKNIWWKFWKVTRVNLLAYQHFLVVQCLLKYLIISYWKVIDDTSMDRNYFEFKLWMQLTHIRSMLRSYRKHLTGFYMSATFTWYGIKYRSTDSIYCCSYFSTIKALKVLLDSGTS